MIYLRNIKVADRRGGGTFATRTVTNATIELWYDPDKLPLFVQTRNKQDGTIELVPLANILSCTVVPESVPKHQPLGTPASRDTKSGQKKRGSMKAFREQLAAKSEPESCE